MKYIKSKYGQFYLFPETVNHWEFATRNGFKEDQIASAGFARAGSNGKLSFYGDSFSLRIASDEGDTEAFVGATQRNY
jgi:hypothetical protein